MLTPFRRKNTQLAIALTLGTCLGLVALGGCERKERVLDVRTPGADVTVDRNVDNGSIEVKANDK